MMVMTWSFSIGGKQFDVPQKKRLDLSQFYGENKYSDGTDIELGD